MRIAITIVQVPFLRGGAESQAEQLRRALAGAGHEADIVTMPYKWYPAERLVDMIAMWRMLDLSSSNGLPIDKVIALKFPCYLAPHPDTVIWLIHQHRDAYDTWDAPHSAMSSDPMGPAVRELIHDVDRAFIARARACYAESRTVQQRLQRYCGLASTVLYHPPPGAERLYRGGYGDYLLVPGRINEAKRQDLVVAAMAHVRSDARIVMMGRPDRPGYGDRLRAEAARFGDRVTWTGYVSDEERLRLFAEARGVLFPPLDEDYGYGTLEAMLSGKAVLTCTDCGGALEFVQDGTTGIISAPTPAALADAIDRFWDDPGFARRAGEAGYELYGSLNIRWDNVVSCLLG